MTGEVFRLMSCIRLNDSRNGCSASQTLKPVLWTLMRDVSCHGELNV